MWYDGFLEHMNTSILRDGVERVYLSLGDREKNTRNPRMAVVEERTRQMAELLEAKGIPCEPIRWDPYTQRPMTFFHDPDGLPLELHG